MDRGEEAAELMVRVRVARDHRDPRVSGQALAGTPPPAAYVPEWPAACAAMSGLTFTSSATIATMATTRAALSRNLRLNMASLAFDVDADASRHGRHAADGALTDG